MLFIIFLLSLSLQAQMVETVDWNSPWVLNQVSDKENLRRLLKILIQSPKGKDLVQLSLKKIKETNSVWWEVLLIGDVSKTKTSYRRKFTNGVQGYQLTIQQKITINKNLSTKEAVLDLAHELSHYSLREKIDPYQKEFSPEQYVRWVVEERGGEVDAYLGECMVAEELFGHHVKTQYCHFKKDEKNIREKVVKDFYSLGDYYSRMEKKLREFGSSLTSSDLGIKKNEWKFISSEYDLPYPLAALEEFSLMKKRIEENNQLLP